MITPLNRNTHTALQSFRIFPFVATLVGMLFLFFVSQASSAPPAEDWVARFDGPGSGYDESRTVALDRDGNIYVTGKTWRGSHYDFLTIKYDSLGTELWVAFYDGPGHGYDAAMHLAVDDLGNVYVTGKSYGIAGSHPEDYATIKYDSQGTELWVARYDGTGSRYDHPYFVAVDATGNVYVTGESEGGGYASGDYATIKYDSLGNEIWVARYDGPANQWDIAAYLAVDDDGNVYVTGSSAVGGSHPNYIHDYITIKYDSNGNELWIARYNGPANGDDRASSGGGLSVDDSGHVYVAGRSEGIGTDVDYTTVKYDSNGNQLWEARYNGSGNGYDWTTALTIDESGYIYVTGYCDGSGTDKDAVTIKYDTDGAEIWEAVYNNPENTWDSANDVELDPWGHVYIAGKTRSSTTGDDYLIIKYDSNGTELWVTTYDGTGNREDGVYRLAVDSFGSVHVTGTSDGIGTDKDGVTIKYPGDDFILELDASYEVSPPGFLLLDFTLSTPEPATWVNYLILTDPIFQVIPLWTIPIPVIDPPIEIPIAFPFSQIGWVGIWTGLFTAIGQQVSDFQWAYTSCTDQDGDGYAIEGGTCGPIDCDDGNFDVNPGVEESVVAESCSDGIDNDCDELADYLDPGCFDNNRLIMHFNGEHGDTFTTDATGLHSVLPFYGDTIIDTSAWKFGGGSVKLDQYGGGYVKIADRMNDFELFDGSTTDVTIQFWARFIRAPSDNRFIIAQSNPTGLPSAGYYWRIAQFYSSGHHHLIFTINDDIGSAQITVIADEFPSDITMFHHYCLVKKGAEYGLYYDGEQVGYMLNDIQYHLGVQTVWLGRSQDNYSNCWMDELVITPENVFDAQPNSENTDFFDVPVSEWWPQDY